MADSNEAKGGWWNAEFVDLKSFESGEQGWQEPNTVKRLQPRTHTACHSLH
jgi:hypothetical protein